MPTFFTRHPELVSGPISPMARGASEMSQRCGLLTYETTGPSPRWALKQVQGDDLGRICARRFSYIAAARYRGGMLHLIRPVRLALPLLRQAQDEQVLWRRTTPVYAKRPRVTLGDAKRRKVPRGVFVSLYPVMSVNLGASRQHRSRPIWGA